MLRAAPSAGTGVCVADSVGCASLEQLLRGLFVFVAVRVVLVAEERGGGEFTHSNNGLVMVQSH